MISLRLCCFGKNTTEMTLCPHISDVRDVGNLIIGDINLDNLLNRCLPGFSTSKVITFPLVIDKYFGEIL